MSKFVFVLTRGLEDPTRATRAFQLAKAANETGHDVSVFLTDDAVLLMREGLIDNVIAPTGDEAASHLQALLTNKVPIYLCTPCAESRRLSPDELPDGAVFAGAPKLFEISEGAVVYTF